MYRTMLKSKIHRATVTEANLNYVGSVTIDQDILDACDILENEKVQIVNNNNGARFETYALSGPRGSGVICLNGGAARMVQQGDIVIILSYVTLTDEDSKTYKPIVALMDKDNSIVEILSEKHGTIA